MTVNVDDPGVAGSMWEGPFEERETDGTHAHPIARAWALWESIKEDWPGTQGAVIANQRAKNMAAAERMRCLGFDYAESLANYEAETVDA